VIDGASHSLAFLGGAVGARQVALGVDRFGQCGSLAALYDHHELSPDAIAGAAIAALEE
jgi:pyruvate dehydrogenase E1 component